MLTVTRNLIILLLVFSGVSSAQTVNQQQARFGIDAACNAVQLQNLEFTLTPGQSNLLAQCGSPNLLEGTNFTLERIAASEAFAIGDALIDTSESQISHIYARINAHRSNRSNSKLPYRQGGSASADTFVDHPLGWFVNGNTSTGKINGAGLQMDADFDSHDLSIGADYRFSRHVVVGAAIGLTSHQTDFSGDNGDLASDGLNLSLFASWYELDEGYADLVVGLGRGAFELERRINFPLEPDEFAIGSTDANAFTFAISAARTLNQGPWTFGPMMRLKLTSSSVDGFTEGSSSGSNGSGTTMDIASHTLRSTRMVAGLDVSRSINTSRAVFVPVLRAEYVIENEQDKGEITATFTHDPSSTQMRFIGTERDDSAVNLTVGSSVLFTRGTSAFIFHESRLSNTYVSQRWIKLGLRMHF
ncbi:MAG: autotransporter outer membrane beta-barrel domain-containing protein [Granulosicoccus sp.]|nr:autotransporter outer membrane beta-barrel domain-containing protein [Granulosicoccus sp.]